MSDEYCPRCNSDDLVGTGNGDNYTAYNMECYQCGYEWDKDKDLNMKTNKFEREVVIKIWCKDTMSRIEISDDSALHCIDIDYFDEMGKHISGIDSIAPEQAKMIGAALIELANKKMGIDKLN